MHQIVLADSAQCGAALTSPDLRPELAGSSYLLVPVSAPGAFHPKVHLLLGKKSGKVLVGSHNLTFGGFGGNAEVTNLIAIEPRDRGRVAVARAALEAIHVWTHGQPALVEQLLGAVEDSAPWLRGPTPTEARELLLWSAPGSTPSLWDQLRSHLRGRCSRVTVIGPYFDDELIFLRRLFEELRPAEFVVGIDPSFAKIDVATARRLKGARFVDVRAVLAQLAGRGASSEEDEDGGPPLHAKMLWIEGNQRRLLITGSANPSRAAWLDTESNAEAVLARVDPEEAILENLALAHFQAAPEVSESQWELVGERMESAGEEGGPRGRVQIAVAEGETIVMRGMRPSIEVATVGVHTRDHGILEGLSWSRAEDVLTVTAAAEVVEAASLVELRGAASSFAIVHHVSRLQPGKGSSSVQGELRSALGAMEVDPTQLGNVMQIIEKAIFDEEGVRFRKGELHAQSNQDMLTAAPIGDLSMPLEEVKRRRPIRKSIADRNLAVVLDLLIYRIGQSLNEHGASVAPPEIEEKDLERVEAEDEPPPDPAGEPVDGEVTLRACHRKVKKLLTRMSDRLERLDGSPEAAASAVAQLAAVVGVVGWLRRSDATFKWLPNGASVVPEDARNQFFWDVAGHFATSKRTPIAIARNELGDGPWQEASLLLALLGWVGWECEIDRRTLRAHPDEEEEWEYGWVSRLAWVLREVALDEGAQTILRDTMTSMRRWRSSPLSWLRDHQGWAEALALLESDPKGAPTLDRPVRRGDFVRLDMPNGKCAVAYVLSLEGQKMFVADPEQVNGRPVLRRFATVLDWEQLAPRSFAAAAS
ncbi:MAG TPA: hypothetical protein VHC69_10020 [Polyangiaceae bacterium]|nr:hypothetical protein [Polyangiaceae bacterium]